jgi:HD-like signal output (HDOD) protein
LPTLLPDFSGKLADQTEIIMSHDLETDHRIQAILASGIKIPPMPDMLIRLNNLLRDPDSGPAELATLIRGDGALSGAIFRVVGSPVFGLRVKVDSLPRAIVLLGIKNTAALLHSEVLRTVLSDPLHTKALQHLWNRGSAIAELCVIAVKKAQLHTINLDAAFLLGMFHDCGLALLCKRFPAYAQALSGDSWPDIAELDLTQQISHAVMGQMVAKNWALPEELVLAIRHHHDVDANELNETSLKLCAALNLAIHLYNQKHALDDRDWQTGWRDEVIRRLQIQAAELAAQEAEILADI